MAIDDWLCAHIEDVLREYTPEAERTKPDFESRLAPAVDKLAHLAKIVKCVQFTLPPPRTPRKRGQRGPGKGRFDFSGDKKDRPSTLAHQILMNALGDTYAEFTGNLPRRSSLPKRGRFSVFAEQMHEAMYIETSLDRPVRKTRDKYFQR